uniref:Phospholipase A2 n=1 Tax=Urocitellus parryii TaxID=9999 RepID=A0A8D2H093_UROPR
MRTLLALAVIMVFGKSLMSVQAHFGSFQKMVSFLTQDTGTKYYRFYGCHCGQRGKGTPKDAIDGCCASHDCCYKRLEKRGCGTKFLSYKFKYQAGKVICEGKKALYINPDVVFAFQYPKMLRLGFFPSKDCYGLFREQSAAGWLNKDSSIWTKLGHRIVCFVDKVRRCEDEFYFAVKGKRE